MKYKSVVVLAGGLCPPELATHSGVKYVADLRFGETSMIERVVDPFRQAGFETIVTVGSDLKGCTAVEAGETFIESLNNGLAACSEPGVIFVATCDTPFLTTAEVLAFDKEVKGSTFYCSVVPVEACKARFPGLARTALRTAEGEFTFGNIVAGEKWVWQHVLPLAQQAFNARKNKLALAWMMGLPTTVRYIRAKKNPSILRLEHLEARASKKIRCPVRAIVGNWPGIGTDVDNLEQYLTALTHLNEPLAV